MPAPETGNALSAWKRPPDSFAQMAGYAAPVSLSVAVLCGVVGGVMGAPVLAIPAVVLAALAGGLALFRRSRMVRPRDMTRSHVGAGASVAADARLEPGALVEAGASVGAGAVIRRGATVRMGSSVGDHAVIGADAVVSWGASVGKGALLGARAVVGSGASVANGAVVPPNTRLMPGSSWSGGATTAAVAPGATVATPDGPEVRIEAACNRLTAQLRELSPELQAFLGTSSQTIDAVRASSQALAERERALRVETSAETLAWLEKERAGLQSRVAQSQDTVIRQSLEGALKAVDDQKRERERVLQSADRIAAELTRLTWTLEGMDAQMVRLRKVGLESTRAPERESLESAGQLRDQISALADALEHIPDGSQRAVSEISDGAADELAPRTRQRS